MWNLFQSTIHSPRTIVINDRGSKIVNGQRFDVVSEKRGIIDNLWVVGAQHRRPACSKRGALHRRELKTCPYANHVRRSLPSLTDYKDRGGREMAMWQPRRTLDDLVLWVNNFCDEFFHLCLRTPPWRDRYWFSCTGEKRVTE